MKNLHLVHSNEAFNHMGACMISDWEESGEAAYAKWFRKELFIPPYNNCYIGCVNENIEALPHPDTTNPIEV